MDHVLGQEALAGPRLPFDQQRQRRARQRLDLSPQLGHRRRAAPEDRPLLRAVRQGERARDLGGQAAAVDHLVLAQVDERIGRPLGAEVGAGGGQHDHRQRRVGGAQPLEDQQPLPPPQLLERRAPRLGLSGQRGLVLGEQPLLGQREVEIEHDQIGQRRLPPERLGRLGVVVRAAERAAARPLLADLAGDAAVAAGDGLELRHLAVNHLHRLIAIVDHQKARHLLPPLRELPRNAPARRTPSPAPAHRRRRPPRRPRGAARGRPRTRDGGAARSPPRAAPPRAPPRSWGPPRRQ